MAIIGYDEADTSAWGNLVVGTSFQPKMQLDGATFTATAGLQTSTANVFLSNADQLGLTSNVSLWDITGLSVLQPEGAVKVGGPYEITFPSNNGGSWVSLDISGDYVFVEGNVYAVTLDQGTANLQTRYDSGQTNNARQTTVGPSNSPWVGETRVGGYGVYIDTEAVPDDYSIDFSVIADVSPYTNTLITPFNNGVKVVSGAVKTVAGEGGFYTTDAPTSAIVSSNITLNGAYPADIVGPALINSSGDGYILRLNWAETRIYVITGGVVGARIGGTISGNPVAGDNAAIHIDTATDTLTTYLNGVLLETLVDTTYTGLRAGFWSYFASQNNVGATYWGARGYPVLTGFNAYRQDILDGLVSGNTALDDFLKATPVANVVRTSDTEVTITVPALTVDIASDLTVVPTIPGSALTGGVALVSSAFDVTADTALALSGASTVTAVSAAASAGLKSAFDTSLATAASAASSAGLKSAFNSSTVTASSALVSLGEKAASSIAAVSATSAVSSLGLATSIAGGSATVTASSSLISTGQKGASSPISVSASVSSTATGTKQASNTATVVAASAATSTGLQLTGVSGSSFVSAISSAVSDGLKAASANISVAAVSSVTAVGTQASGVIGTSTVSASSEVTSAGSKAASDSTATTAASSLATGYRANRQGAASVAAVSASTSVGVKGAASILTVTAIAGDSVTAVTARFVTAVVTAVSAATTSVFKGVPSTIIYYTSIAGKVMSTGIDGTIHSTNLTGQING